MSKLSLRDLFAVVTIVAVLVAWWVDHRIASKAATESQSEIISYQHKVEVMKAELERTGHEVTVSADGVHILAPDGVFFGGKSSP